MFTDQIPGKGGGEITVRLAIFKGSLLFTFRIGKIVPLWYSFLNFLDFKIYNNETFYITLIFLCLDAQKFRITIFIQSSVWFCSEDPDNNKEIDFLSKF